MKNLFTLLVAFSLGVVFLSGCNLYHSEPKHYKIGIVNISTGLEGFVVGFKEGLAESGLIEGRNVTFYYNGPITKEKAKTEINDLKGKGIDLLYTLSTPVTKIAQQEMEGTDIPIVFAPVFSPVEAGIISADPKARRNITGVKVRGSTQKALEMLVTVVPQVKNIFVPFHVSDKAAQLTVVDMKKAAAKLRVKLHLGEVKTAAELDKVILNIPADTDAIFLTHSHLILSKTAKIVAAATNKKIPVVSSAAQYNEGVLISYSIEYNRMGKQASRLAVKLLNGIDPSVLPIETGEYFFGINLITANRIGVEIPYNILAQADFIIREPLN